MAKKYDESSISVLKGLEQVRKRPAMYMGVRGDSMLYRMLKEPVDNSVDEALAGRNQYIEVSIDSKKNIFVIKDKAQGIPVGINKVEQKSTLEIVMTYLHAGGKFDDKDYKFSSGTHGIGVAATNALSKICKVWTYREGVCWHQEYSKGVPKFAVKQAKLDAKINALLKDKSKTGTVLYFEPDQTIIANDKIPAKLDRTATLTWLKYLALLNKGLTIVVTCDGKEFTFINKIGPELLMKAREKALSVTRNGKAFLHESETCTATFAFSDYAETDGIQSFVCNSPTKLGGTHVKGFVNVITKVLAKYALKKDKYIAKDLLSGLIGVLNWRMSEPEFTSQVKDELDSNVTKQVEEVLMQPIDAFFSKNKKLARDIIKRAVAVSASREQYKKVLKSITEVKKTGKRMLLPNVLASAAKAKPCDRELFCAEGDSAYGSCKKARDASFQEVLKLKGKPVNAMRASVEDVLSNEVIQNLLVALDVDVEAQKKGKIFDCHNLRVQNVYLLADADEDGPLRGDTKVLTLDGRNPTIAQLCKEYTMNKKPIWVYSYDGNGKLIPTKAYEPKVYKTVSKMVELTLDNGKVIYCTLNHKWVLNTDLDDLRAQEYLGNLYVSAKQLKKGDSIKSVYFDIGNADGNASRKRKYRIIKNDGNGNRIPEHRWVKRHVDCKEFNTYVAANRGVQGGSVHIRHIDGNSLNNVPDNLTYISKEDHYAEHGELNRKAYNGSAKHLKDLENFRNTEKVKEQIKKSTACITTYNRSEQHRAVVAKNNSDPYYIERQLLGKICRHAVNLISAGLALNEENWNLYRVNTVPSWIFVKDRYSLVRILKETIKFGLSIKDAKPLVVKDKSSYSTQMYSKFLAVCREIVDRDLQICKENYNRVRKFRNVRGDPKWETVASRLSESDSKLSNTAKHDIVNNHKVASIKIVECEPTDMYCLTVPETGNFMVDDGNGNGICSANCHINLLMVAFFYKFIPDMIKQGRLHLIDAPLFFGFWKNKRYFGSTFQDCYKQMPKDAPKHSVIRAKGWGEVASDALAVVAFNPETRGVITLTYPKAKDMLERYASIVSDDTAARKELLGV